MTSWSQTTPQAAQFQPTERGLDALFGRIARLENLVKELTGANILGPAGLAVDPGGLTIASSLIVTGNTFIQGALDVGGDAQVTGLLQSENYVTGTSGWRLTSTGLEVNDITIRGGIIGNDSLTSPILVRPIENWSTGWGMPGAEQVLVSKALAVPAGYTKATVTVTVTLSILGYSGSGDSYVRARAGVDSALGIQSTAFLYDYDSITMSATTTTDFTGLSGGSLTAKGYGVALAGAKPAVASNTAVISGVALFTR